MSLEIPQFETLLVERDGPVLHVVLNRPEARNALSSLMEDEFDKVLELAELDGQVRAVMVTGAGPVFCAGHDLKEHRPKRSVRAPSLPRAWYFRKPLIAGVHGYVGPYANHILGCFDFIIAASGTKFSFEYTRRGAEGAGGNIISMQLPMRVLKKLYLLGGWFTAERALDWDYVQRVVSINDLHAETRRWAVELSKVPPLQISTAKEGIHRNFEIMGLLGIVGIGNRVSGRGSPTDDQFHTQAQGGALRNAIKQRDAEFDSDIARI